MKIGQRIDIYPPPNILEGGVYVGRLFTKVPVKRIAYLVVGPPNFHNYRVSIVQVRGVSTIPGPLGAIIRLYQIQNILSHNYYIKNLINSLFLLPF
jgi:hypothetical protein